MIASGPVIPNFGHGSSCVTGDHLFCWDWVRQHWGDTLEPHLVQHVELTLIAVSIGFVIAFALALITHRVGALDQPVAIVAGLIYTIPSLVAFQILIAYSGLSTTTVVIPLVGYSLVILYPNIVAGLRAAPPEVLEAARGMGLTQRQVLTRVELPLALPAIFGGLRIAVVSTVAIATVETTATRRPPMIAGSASGSSTRVSTCRRVSPIPRAASITSAGGERSPATMFGYRITSE